MKLTATFPGVDTDHPYDLTVEITTHTSDTSVGQGFVGLDFEYDGDVVLVNLSPDEIYTLVELLTSAANRCYSLRV